MFKNKVAVIMAGGKSSRMKCDKALLPFGAHKSLSEYQYSRLNKFFSKVYISAKEDKFDFEVEIIKDMHTIASPLVALISIFETLELDEVFVLSVDAPFVKENMIEELYRIAKLKSDVIMLESKNTIQPLCAIYRRSFLGRARIALEKNKHRLQTLFDDLIVQKVFLEDEHAFMNLNYPDEYEEAKLLVKRRG